MIKENVAKVIRILSIPPIMISMLVIILYFSCESYFRGVGDIVISLLLLGGVPVFAYPLQKVIPKLREKGRSGQRKLAFVTNLVGYSAAFAWTLVAKVYDGLLLICASYFVSVVLLAMCNVFDFKASGHASSFTGPLVVLVYALGWKVFIPCFLWALAIVWSSLELKRHTMKQILAGVGVYLVSFAMALLLIGIS